ncbi:MAG: squalene synthase HpnC [Ignavibacteriaceae bacterium]
MSISAESYQDSSIGYNKALDFAKSHYENFPIVSFFVPKRLRKHVAIIYWFARSADDIADERNEKPEFRLVKLNEFELKFKQALNGKPGSAYFSALSETITVFNLTPKHFTDLLNAFKQDVVKNRYGNYEELLNYCNHSANPVGRLILELFDVRNKDAYYYSDEICTALQLTNFFQDTKIDFIRGRIYYTQAEMERFGVTEKMFELNENNLNLQKLVKFNVERARVLFSDGKKILKLLKGGLKLEVRWTVKGGEAILDRITKNNFDVLNKRPVLSKTDFVKLFFTTIFNI